MTTHAFRALAAYLLLAALFTNTSSAQTTVLAVDFTGDITSGNANSSLDTGAQVVLETGDFNGDTTTDARIRIPMDHAGNFINIGSPVTPGKSSTWASGVEVVNYDTTDTSGAPFPLYRMGAADILQLGSPTGPAGSTGQSMAFAPHVRKTAFLNGASTAATASFTDDAAGFTIDWNFQNSPVFNNTLPGVAGRRVRATVQNGSDWYVTGWTSGSKDSDRTFNPYTETWYPFDVDTSLFVEVQSGTNTPVGTGVLGSTFTDIQAIGGLMTYANYTGSSNNIGVHTFQNMTASLDITLPPPPTPQTGVPIAKWGMESVTPGAITVDPFNNALNWTGPAVPDDTFGPSEILHYGDPNQPPVVPTGTFDQGDAPNLTAGGQGFIGEALRFNGNEEDEAVSIVGWKGDDNESFVTEDTQTVYVDFYFKEDDNTNGAIQNLVGVRSTWEVRILPTGELEWLTFLDAGGSDSITAPLGVEGAWRHVQAWSDENGVKGLMLDGVLVASSAPGIMVDDTASIVLGNRENNTRHYSGLIDEVFVGTGVPDFIDGDFNGDGVVDAADYTVWRDTVGATGTFLPADGNGDGVVDGADYTLWSTNFGNAASSASSATSVPEPGTLVLIGFACAAFQLRSRKRQA